MTEEEWKRSTDPLAMLDSLSGDTSDRKMRLFACACVRHVWPLLADERSRSAVETAERCAEGSADRGELAEARDNAREAARQIRWPVGPDTAWRAACAAQNTTRESGRSAARNTFCDAARSLNRLDTNQFDDGEIETEVAYLRDIFGNPFRAVAFDSSWRTADVLALAQIIYDLREFNRMPDLAVTLERAGCHEQAILDHCREPDQHVRGCWAIDLVLGKE